MIKRTHHFFRDIYDKRELLYELAKRDFQQQYMGSYLGFVWVYLRPLLFISVMYMVFTFGFRAGRNVGDVSFAVYLVTGMIPWLFFADNLNASTGVIRQYAFLLKKVDFRLSILPIVKLLSASAVHLFFIIVMIMFVLMGGGKLSLYMLQLPYYFLSMLTLLLGLGWLTSSTNVFVRDVSNVVGVVIQFGFWLTPIFWNISMVPEAYRWIIRLNPAYYIVQGYRDAVFGQVWFWERPFEMLGYWGVTALTLYVGITVFKKLRPHFAEVV